MSRPWSHSSPRAVAAKRLPSRPQVPRETFGMLRLRGDYLIDDFAALGFCLLATCPGGRERLIDPRDATWHHLHRRSLATLRRCEGCRARVGVTVVPPWYRRKGFDVRAMTALDMVSTAG